MPTLNLMKDSFSPVSNGASKQDPATYTDVVSSGFEMNRDNYYSNSSSRILAELRDARSDAYMQIENKPLLGINYSKSNPVLSLGATQDSAAFSPLFTPPAGLSLAPDLWGFAQRLHTDDTYVNLHIKELKEKDPQKYASLLTNEEIKEAAKGTAIESTADFNNVASRASDDALFYGSITAALGGALTDPINILTLPLGASAGGGVLRAVAVEASIQAGVEVATQPIVMAWQKEIGQEYGIGEAATSVLAAATIGGGFAAVTRGAVPTAQAAFARMQESKALNSIQKQAAGYMSRYAHFNEANPDPKVVSEAHTDNVGAVSKVVREGKNPSTASLPTTDRDFMLINSDIKSNIPPRQQSILQEVQNFQGFRHDASRILNEIAGIKKEIAFLNKQVKESGSIVGAIRKMGGAKVDGTFSAELRNVFEGRSGAFTLSKKGKGLDDVARELEIQGLIRGKNGEEAQPQDVIDAIEKEIASGVVVAERSSASSLDRIIDEFEFRGINDKSSIDDIELILKSEFESSALTANRLIDEYMESNPTSALRAFDSSVKSSDNIPSVIEPIPQPLTNSQTSELLKRVSSVEVFSNDHAGKVLFHGTDVENVQSIKRMGLKLLKDRPQDVVEGGGHGVSQRSISLSTTRRTAATFATARGRGSVFNVHLSDDARVIKRTDIDFAEDLDDEFDELISKGVDAVDITHAGENEIVILNPDKIKLVGEPEGLKGVEASSFRELSNQEISSLISRTDSGALGGVAQTVDDELLEPYIDDARSMVEEDFFDEIQDGTADFVEIDRLVRETATELAESDGVDLGAKAELAEVPSTLDPIPEPLTNSQTDELLKRISSIETEKANIENFKQLVEANPSKTVTLEDGTDIKLSEIQKQFDDEQTFLDEISTCAIG